jgi:hypothetical protein
LSLLQQEFAASGRQALVYSGGRAAAGSSAAADTEASGKFTAVESYGDVTMAGVGTTTAVCGQRALALSDPMNWTGKVSYRANDAASVAIVRDATLGSLKMPNLAGTVGVGGAGPAVLTAGPAWSWPRTAFVTSTITNADSGARRVGTTRVVDPAFLALATKYGVGKLRLDVEQENRSSCDRLGVGG